MTILYGAVIYSCQNTLIKDPTYLEFSFNRQRANVLRIGYKRSSRWCLMPRRGNEAVSACFQRLHCFCGSGLVWFHKVLVKEGDLILNTVVYFLHIITCNLLVSTKYLSRLGSHSVLTRRKTLANQRPLTAVLTQRVACFAVYLFGLEVVKSW